MSWQLLGIGVLLWCVIATGIWLGLTHRHYYTLMLAALNGLNHTHLQGFEVLTIEIDRLKARIAELERR
jgi:hypothetical protein